MAAALMRISRPGCRIFFSSETAAFIPCNIHTGVWWDINECKVPKGCDASSIAGNITAALAKLNYNAPVDIFAHGNMNRIPLKVRQALSDSGVLLAHVPGHPSDFKDMGYSLCTLDINRVMYRWTEEHPPPGNCLFICGNGTLSTDLTWPLGLPRSRGYDILLASPREGGYELKMSLEPKAIWRWTSLRAGGVPEWTSGH